MGLSPFSPCPRRIWEGYKVCAPKGKTAEPSVLTLGQQVATYPQITQITQIFLDTASPMFGGQLSLRSSGLAAFTTYNVS